MKNICKQRNFLSVLTLVLLIAFGVPAPICAASASPVGTQQKSKAAQQKKKQQKKQQQKKQQQQKKKQQQKQQAKKQQAKQQQAQKQQAQKQQAKPSQEEAYELKVSQIEAYNRRVSAYMNRDISHRLGVWGQFGYSSLFQNFGSQSGAAFAGQSKGWLGGGAGLGYQLRYKRMLFTTGLEYEHYNSLTGITAPDGSVLTRTFGLQPYEATMTYTYAFPRMTDRWTAAYVQLPVLFGGEWDAVYFLAGPKVGLNVIGRSQNNALLTTSASDAELSGPLGDMFTHALVTESPYEMSPAKLQFGLNLALAAEVGLNLDRWISYEPKQDKGGKKQKENTFLKNLHYRVGLFAEYGILNIQSAQNAAGAANDMPAVFLSDPANPLKLPLTSALQTSAAGQVAVNPFLVGVKASIWYELPRKQKRMQKLPAEPTPRLAVRVQNSETGRGIGGALVSIYNGQKDKMVRKTTNGSGMAVGRFSRGSYRINAERAGYLSGEAVDYTLRRDLQDTLVLSLVPEPKPVEYLLCGYVLDGDTRTPLEAQLTLSDAGGTPLYQGTASDDGLFVTSLPAGTYYGHFTLQGYMPLDDTLRFEQDTLTVLMHKIREGRKVRINNLYFATGKTVILPESEAAMEDLAQFLTDNPEVRILIVGHTDDVGSDQANQRLSEGRAAAVRQNLIMRNISSDRIESEGRGESEPVADNLTEEGRAQNRRVEFTIISTGASDIKQIR